MQQQAGQGAASNQGSGAAASATSASVATQFAARMATSIVQAQLAPSSTGLAVDPGPQLGADLIQPRPLSGEAEGRGQHGQVLAARQLPWHLDVRSVGVGDRDARDVLERPAPPALEVQLPVDLGAELRRARAEQVEAMLRRPAPAHRQQLATGGFVELPPARARSGRRPGQRLEHDDRGADSRAASAPERGSPPRPASRRGGRQRTRARCTGARTVASDRDVPPRRTSPPEAPSRRHARDPRAAQARASGQLRYRAARRSSSRTRR